MVREPEKKHKQQNFISNTYQNMLGIYMHINRQIDLSETKKGKLHLFFTWLTF